MHSTPNAARGDAIPDPPPGRTRAGGVALAAGPTVLATRQLVPARWVVQPSATVRHQAQHGFLATPYGTRRDRSSIPPRTTWHG